MGTLTLQPNCLENFWSPEHDMIFCPNSKYFGSQSFKMAAKNKWRKTYEYFVLNYNKSQREEDFRT